MAKGFKVGTHVRSIVTDDGGVVLNVDTGIYYSLNRIGTVVWNAVKQGEGEEEMVAHILGILSVPSDRVRRDVQSFLNRLSELHLIERDMS